MDDLLPRLQDALSDRYRIEREIGRGGMATVFLAEDLKHHRRVAIKILDPDVAAAIGPERFLREIRTVAQLSHPHILPLHDSSAAGGFLYYVMPFAEGESLRDRLTREKQLPLADALQIAREVASALSYAHSHDVVHRDIKPENILLHGGHAVIADFGIARAVAATDRQALTATGIAVGTPMYTSPEQAAGSRELDGRSDLYSLGCVLYEMLAGVPPFAGATVESLAYQHMSAAPRPVTQLRPAVPVGIAAALQQSLAKAPADRFGSVALFAEVLGHRETAAMPEVLPAAPATLTRRPLRLALLGGAMTVLALAAAIVGGWYVRRQSAAPPELKQRQLTSSSAGNPVLTGYISPDGKTLAFVDRSGLSLRSIESGESHPIELPAGLTFDYPLAQINWFPDGSQLLVSGRMADRRPAVWALPVTGGRTHKVLDDASFAVLSPDGTHIAYKRRGVRGSEIWVSGVNGEDARRVTGDDSSGVIPAWAVWSPNGKRLAYGRADRGAQTLRLESCDLAGRTRVFYSPTADRPLDGYTIPLWLPDGRVAFGLTDPPPNQRDMNLWSLRVDPRSGVPSGSPRRITQWQRLALVVPTALSTNGKRLSVGVLEYQSDIYVGRMAVAGALLQDVRRVTLDDRMDMMPAWMADDSTIMFCSDRNGTFDIFRQRMDAAVAEPVVTGPRDQYSPHLSPDRAWILYREEDAARPGKVPTKARLMRVPVAGGPAEKVLDAQGIASFRSPQATGASPVLCELQNGSAIFSAFDPVRGRGRELSRAEGHKQLMWDLSPDGSTIAMVVPSQDSLPRIRMLSTSGAPPHEIRLDRPVQIANLAYGADGRSWLIVQAGKQWRLLHVDARGRTSDLIPPQMWMYSAAVSPDGKRVAYTSNTGQGNIWMLEDF